MDQYPTDLYSCTMRNSNLNTWLIEIISALFILLFVYTGISKLNERYIFSLVLSQSPLIGANANLLSWLLPVAELSTALLLLILPTRKWGLIISLLLMCIFTGYIAYMLLLNSGLPCSCGGVFKQMTWTQHLVFNIILTGLNVAGLWSFQKNKLFIAISRNSRIPV